MKSKIAIIILCCVVPLDLSCRKEEANVAQNIATPTAATPVAFKTPSPQLDPCIIGTWEADAIKPLNNSPYTGGTGFRLTFKNDGTQTADYSAMKPLKSESIT